MEYTPQKRIKDICCVCGLKYENTEKKYEKNGNICYWCLSWVHQEWKKNYRKNKTKK